MGQFKPMVKMFTDEPSVILKLKKGGKVKSKAAGQAEGFKTMAHNTQKMFEGAEEGVAPKKPSMAMRRKAMNPNQYAKGGKVAHKQLGGAMPAVMNPAGSNVVGAAPMQAMGRAALAGMAPTARASRAAAVRRALMGMKKGGAAASECAKLEKELKHHESMSMDKAHPVKKASGGAIDSAETKTTLKNSVKPFAKTKMDTAHKDKAHGTGEVKEGKPAGYKMGGTIEGNEKQFENTKMVTSKVDRAHGTGGVRMSNAGGFKKGGKVPGLGNAIEGGNWENRPANTAKPGKKGTHTGEVKESNAGGYRHGGHAKKRYATGGNVIDDGKAVKYPPRIKHSAVANTMQSGTYRRGGKVHHHADGELVSANPSSVTVKKSEITTDIPTAAQAERMRREMEQRRMDRDTDKGYDRFMKDFRLKKKGGRC